MIEATRGRKAGQWSPVADGCKVSAVYYCAKCAHPMGLMNHHIESDGSISPSVVCPNPVLDRETGEDMRSPTLDCASCDFHNYVRLIGWQ